MRLKIALTTLLAAVLVSAGIPAAAQGNSRDYRQALGLYRNGMYERARTLFEKGAGDPMSDGYAVLCAIKLRTDDYEELIDEYFAKHPSTSLSSRIRFEHGRLLFDAGKYTQAMSQFSLVDSGALDKAEVPEFFFKSGYCKFAEGNYTQAKELFTVLDAMDYSEYTAPGLYTTGIMYYNDSQFASAEPYFRKSASDPRFKDLSEFYLVDCEFNRKNYDYTIEEGEKMFPSVPAERKDRLARMISESYLVKGNAEKAREYYDAQSHKEMNNKDWFYAGTVMYAMSDYKGAIENFTKITDRTDSLGQLANYHLGNSYIRTRNKVAAMGAFKDASETDHDPKVTEDALFNYAKLAFDLNKDTQGFKTYISKYSTKAKGNQIYGYMALAALYDRDYASAVEAYDNIDELAPDMQNNYTKANFLRAEQLFSNGSYRDAAPYFRATAYYLPKTDRLNQMARYWMGESYYRSGNFSESGKTFTDLFNNEALYDKAEGQILPYNVGYSWFKQQDYVSAARWFDTYINSGNLISREDALTRRADCDFARHDYKAAIESYQKVIDQYSSPDNIYPYYQQALCYGLTGERKLKAAALERVEKASPDAAMYSEAYYELGKARMEAGDSEGAAKAFAHLRDNTKDDTSKAKALIGLGTVSRNSGSYDSALGYYKQVVALQPGTEYAQEALSAIESIYNAKRQPEKYLEYLEENSLNSGKTDEEKEQMYFNAAEQLYLAENWQQTISAAQKFLDSYPSSDKTLQAEFYIAESYKALGDKEKACDWYSKVMDSGSDSSFAEMSRLRFADLSYSLERYKDALGAYTSLLGSTKIEDNKAAARTGMMRSAYRSKDYEAAIMDADVVMGDKSSSAALKREAQYIKAKSCLATSKRDQAMAMFKTLSADPSTAEGAEARYMIIQNLYDTGSFDSVENEVYSFSQKAGDQSYWLAKAYIVLGDSFAEREEYDQAKATFESIRSGYTPESSTDDVLDNVNMRLERLQTLMKK